MVKLTFESPSGLGSYQINEPTRQQLQEVIHALREHWGANTAKTGAALESLVLKVSGVDLGNLCALDVVLLADELATHYFVLATAGSKKKPASPSGPGAES